MQCGDPSKMEGEDFSCQHYRRKCKFVVSLGFIRTVNTARDYIRFCAFAVGQVEKIFAKLFVFGCEGYAIFWGGGTHDEEWPDLRTNRPPELSEHALLRVYVYNSTCVKLRACFCYTQQCKVIAHKRVENVENQYEHG